MPRYNQIKFLPVSPAQSDLLLAALAQIGYEGFEEEEGSLKAFIKEKDRDDAALKEVAERFGLGYRQSILEETNWNAVWESNFQPVIVDDFAAIRAEFHTPVSGVKYELLITPKMSFGTGHHATTYMMIQQMREINFTGTSVFDFGTGTGILSILAEKLGARIILATDHDEWSINNAAENIERNRCSRIILEKGDGMKTTENFDIILANINKNVICENFSSLAHGLSPDGILLVSGLLVEDEPAILNLAESFRLTGCGRITRQGWICLCFKH
jgi:ribosomal protein L11 methyltransferase